MSFALLVPLVLTANRRAQRWLGTYWRWIHRLTYVVWVTILIHLLLLFGFRTLALDALIISCVLFALRVPIVVRWWVSSRRAGKHRVARALIAAALLACFGYGTAPFVQELATKGSAAFMQAPVDD